MPSLLLIVFAAIGVEALRRQVIREFPDRVTTHSAEGIAQRCGSGCRRPRRAERAPRPASRRRRRADPQLDALERLGKLRESGVLTDDELAAEKRRIMEGAPGE